jgi:hypothetical protein
VLVVLGLAVLVGPAQAQISSSALFFGAPGTKVVSGTDIPITAHGEVVVSFRGDAAAGCAAYGLCAYSGTIVLRPQGGTLTVITLRHRGRIERQVELVLGSGGGAYATSARVQRSDPNGQGGTCADAPSTFFGPGAGAVTHGDLVTIRLLAPDGSLLQTRCAGPLDGDLATASPSVTVRTARLLRGRMVLDLSGTGTFSVHGFAGTITSTLAMNLGKPRSQPPLNSWRTHCPGPMLGNASTGVAAALRPGALGRRVFTVKLHGKGSFTDDGYVVTPQGSLSVVLRRGHVTQQVITEPTS